MIKRLVHTGVSDDLDLLVDTLRPAAGRRFVTVSAHGAGEAALALAALGAEEVVALDIEDPGALLRLVEIKTRTAELFGREDALVVLGLRSATALRRRALARQLLVSLEPEQAAYWRPRRKWLEEGLFHADQMAQVFRLFLGAVRLLAPADVARQIVCDPDPERRVTAFLGLADRRWLRTALSQLGRVNLFFPDAEWRASEYPRVFSRDPLGYLTRLVEAGLADNPLFAHVVAGRDGMLAPHLMPPHLRPGTFDGLRARASKVRTLSAPSGTSRLSVPLSAGAHDGAYLSNTVDYLDADQRAYLFREVRRSLKVGAPILVYSNEAYSKVPLEAGFERDDELSFDLAERDRAKIYRRVDVYRSVDRSTHSRRLRVVG